MLEQPDIGYSLTCFAKNEVMEKSSEEWSEETTLHNEDSEDEEVLEPSLPMIPTLRFSSTVRFHGLNLE